MGMKMVSSVFEVHESNVWSEFVFVDRDKGRNDTKQMDESQRSKQSPVFLVKWGKRKRWAQAGLQIQFLMYHNNEQQTYLMNYFQKLFKYHLQ